MVHAYVLCTNVLLGHIPHDCTTTRAPHRVLVCVVKRSVPLCLYTELVGRADESGRGLTPQDAVHRFERWSLVLTGAGLLATAVVLGRRRKRLTARTSRDLANQLPPPRQHHILAA
jgi:hypothetical protein